MTKYTHINTYRIKYIYTHYNYLGRQFALSDIQSSIFENEPPQRKISKSIL